MQAMATIASQQVTFQRASAGVFSARGCSADAAVSERSSEEEGDLAAQIVTLRPRLVRFAWSLTHDRESAEDLAQETIAALSRRSGDFSAARISGPGCSESSATFT